MKFVSLDSVARKIRTTRPLRRYASRREDPPPRRSAGLRFGLPVGGRTELRAVLLRCGHCDGIVRTLTLSDGIADGDPRRDTRPVPPSHA